METFEIIMTPDATENLVELRDYIVNSLHSPGMMPAADMSYDAFGKLRRTNNTRYFAGNKKQAETSRHSHNQTKYILLRPRFTSITQGLLFRERTRKCLPAESRGQ